MNTPIRIPRRAALARLGAASLLSLGLWPGSLARGAGAGADARFKFIAVNDLHHDTDQCNDWFAAVTRQMRGHKEAEFALLLGDLTDKGKLANLGAIRDHFKTLGIPFHAQIGNHDYLTATDRSPYETIFADRINYLFEHQGWYFLGIDSTQGLDFSNTTVQPATLAWLDATLPKLDRRRPIALFTHFPLAQGVPMAPLNSDAVLERFLNHNLQGVFGGHHHGYTARQKRGFELVTNRCCALIRDNHDQSKEKGYWIVTAAEGKLTREFVEFKGPAGTVPPQKPG